MDILNIISIVTALLTTIAAILAWIAKIRWSNEYSRAKDEIIRAKEAQIAGLESQVKILNDMTPMKVREYYLSMKQQLEEYNQLISEQLSQARQDILQKEADISLLRQEGDVRVNEIAKLNSEKAELQTLTASMERELAVLHSSFEGNALPTDEMAQETFKTVSALSAKLSEASPRTENNRGRRRRQLSDQLMITMQTEQDLASFLKKFDNPEYENLSSETKQSLREQLRQLEMEWALAHTALAEMQSKESK